MSLIFSLPEIVGIETLSHWLNDFSLTCFDSSLCSHSWRTNFLDNLRHPYFTSPGVNCFNRLEYFNWLKLRQIKPKSFILIDDCSSNNIPRSFDCWKQLRKSIDFSKISSVYLSSSFSQHFVRRVMALLNKFVDVDTLYVFGGSSLFNMIHKHSELLN
jgi:hypothetical protein